jgi:hypothetical protein
MRRRRWRTVVAATAALSMITASVALADQLFIDGDGLVPVTSSPQVNLGAVCAGEAVSGDVLLAIERRSGASAAVVFANGATVTISQFGSPSAGLSQTLSTSSVTLPMDWTVSAFGTMSAPVTSTVTLEAPSVAGPWQGTIAYRAEGTRASDEDETVTLNATLTVNAMVDDCAPVDTTPPDVKIDISPQNPTGDNDWYNSPVTLSVSATDDGSDVESIEYQ